MPFQVCFQVCFEVCFEVAFVAGALALALPKIVGLPEIVRWVYASLWQFGGDCRMRVCEFVAVWEEGLGSHILAPTPTTTRMVRQTTGRIQGNSAMNLTASSSGGGPACYSGFRV